MEVVRDQSVFIEAATHAVREHLILGGFLASLVVLFFLGNIRSTAISAIATRTRAMDGVRYTLVTVADDTQETVNLAKIYVRLRETTERKRTQQELMGDVRSQVLPQFSGRDLRLGDQPVPTFSGGGQKNATIQYVMSGPEIKELSAYSEQALAMGMVSR